MTRRLVRLILVCAFIGGGVMALAGQWDSPYLWAFTAIVVCLGAYAVYGVLDPELARERFRPPVPGADAVALRFIRISALVAIVFAPLDGGRLHWSAAVPAAVRVVGLCGCFAGALFTFRAMAVNRFFSTVVRVQSERGHRVVDAGPYAVIRHPGYIGMIVMCPMAVLALGSWWALVPAGAYSALILRRVVFEDRFLHQYLEGYGEYAARVRFRLLPGVW